MSLGGFNGEGEEGKGEGGRTKPPPWNLAIMGCLPGEVPLGIMMKAFISWPLTNL